MSQNITKDNHYVPQLYLRNWSADGTKLCVYQTLVPDRRVRLWVYRSIEYSAFHQHLYTTSVNGEPRDEYERWFNSTFETPAQPVIEKVINGNHLNQKDYEILIKFLAVQMLRTPRWYDYFVKTSTRVFQDVSQKTVDSLEETLRKGNPLPSVDSDSGHNSFQIHLRKLADLNSETLLYQAELFIGQRAWLSEVKNLLPKIISLFMKYSWCILNAPDDCFFPTSDDPVVCMGYRNSNEFWFEGVGIGQDYADIFMPLSPKHLLFTEVGRKNESWELNRDWFKFFHDMIIRHSNRYVYSLAKIKNMLVLRPRTVNRELFLSEQEYWKNWLKSQQQAEMDWDSDS